MFDHNRDYCIYIAGYGRSGSTVLDMFLDKEFRSVSVGEACNLFNRKKDNEGIKCSCGSFIGNGCGKWDDVCTEVQSDCSENSEKMHQLLSDVERNRSGQAQKKLYINVWRKIFMLASDKSSEKPTLFIDSSKSARGMRRLEYLYEIFGERLIVVHLVRNPAAVLYSRRQGRNMSNSLGKQHRFSTIRTVYGWVVANNYVSDIGTKGVIRPLLLKYEKFAVGPTKFKLNLLETFPELQQFSENAADVSEHVVSGNRVRNSQDLVIGLDRKWEGNSTFFEKILLKLVTPITRKYDYTS